MELYVTSKKPMPCITLSAIKHDGHLRTREKFGENEPQMSVFYFPQAFSNVWSVLSQCNTWLRLLYLLYNGKGEIRACTGSYLRVYYKKQWDCLREKLIYI